MFDFVFLLISLLFIFLVLCVCLHHYKLTLNIIFLRFKQIYQMNTGLRDVYSG